MENWATKPSKVIVFCSTCRRNVDEDWFPVDPIRAGRKLCRDCCYVFDSAIQRQENARARTRDYRKVRPLTDEQRARQLDMSHRTKYGIGIAEKQAMIKAQKGRCKCCGIKFLDTIIPCTDHINDKDGKPIVRGILCSNCNSGIGMLGDNLGSVLNAVRYLSEQPSTLTQTA